MRFGIVVFPGTWSDQDCFNSLGRVLGQEVDYVWHKETDLSRFDCIILPGGFSYGDYLRTGAIARFSPVMNSLKQFIEGNGLVLGICNGFQILCEAGFLPGALVRNESLEFRCEWTHLRVENAQTSFSREFFPQQVIKIPISHGEGRYFADKEILTGLEKENRVVFRYSNFEGIPTSDSNPNGSLNNIAGIINARGNVLGMMPHPERACELLLGGDHGASIFRSLFKPAD
jgi:phosphoribosylformylglycinamidine synthase